MKLTRCKLSKKIAVKTARTVADLVGIHHNVATLFYHKIRLVIGYHLDFEAEAEIEFDSEIELDKNYLGDVRKGKRGRGAGDKTIVFGILKRKDRVYNVIAKTPNKAS